MPDELESALVEQYCERNGWEVGDNEDYDNAVRDVKWFLAKAKPIIEKQEINRILGMIKLKYFASPNPALAGGNFYVMSEEDHKVLEGEANGQGRP